MRGKQKTSGSFSNNLVPLIFILVFSACRPSQPRETAGQDVRDATMAPPEATAEPAASSSTPIKTCALDEPRRVELDVKVKSVIGRVGEATWAFVDGPNGGGLLTVGREGNPQITLTPLFVEMIHVSDNHIWLGQRRPRPSPTTDAAASYSAPSKIRLVSIDVSNTASPRVGTPIDPPFTLPGVDTFAMSDALALFVHQGRVFLWDRRSGDHREHSLGTDMGNFTAWCSSSACFVVAQTEMTGLRLRLRLWRFVSTAPPTVELVADEAARGVLALPDGDARWLLWTMDNVLHARRVEADGTMPSPVHTHRPELIALGSLVPTADEAGGMGVLYRLHQTRETYYAPLHGPSMGTPVRAQVPTASHITAASTSEGTLYLAWDDGEVRGIRVTGRHRHGHRYRFRGTTVFQPAGGAAESQVELVDHSGGGLFTVHGYPIASREGFAVVFSFGYHPWDQPSYWLVRGPC